MALFLHHALNCKDCGFSIWMEAGQTQRMFTRTENPPNDRHAIALVCPYCKSVDTYILHKAVKGHNPKDRVVMAEPNYGEVVHVTTLECSEPSCQLLLPLLAIWGGNTTAEDRAKDMNGWRWSNLKCPEGHAIPAPILER